MGHMTWPCSFSDSLSSVGCDLLWSTCTPNLKSLCSPTTKTWKAMQNEKMGRSGVTDHPRSPAMSAFDRVDTTSYSSLIESYASMLYRFWVIASYLSKVANFNLSHLHLAPRLGDPVRILPKPLASENQTSWAIVWRCLRNSTFSRFDTIPACDGQTDGRTRRRLIPW